MKLLVTGGAGFIGRWIVKKLLDSNVDVWVLDDLSNGKASNLDEFEGVEHYHGLIVGDICDSQFVETVLRTNFDICIHAAAQINVQDSLDNPQRSFETNVVGSYNILSNALRFNTRVVLIGTCMVYDLACSGGISELSPVKPTSPYAGSKLAAEDLALSYYFGFNLPVIVLRPFNTYGPFQKADMEGGVVSIFLQNHVNGENLKIFGDGTQTRDLLYVEDCADFIVAAAFSDSAVGQVINAATGRDISINDLAFLICNNTNRIEHVEHHHPQSEIQKLLGDFSKAQRVLGWEPTTSLEEGIRKTEQWIKTES